MIAPLYTFQQKVIDENPKKTGILWGTGVGKSRIALELSEGSILIICPKQQKLDCTWEKNNEKFNLNKNITVISKETFRRDWETISLFDTVICDEFHNLCGVSPETHQRNHITIPKTSKMFEAALSYMIKHPPKRLYLLSATPASKPMNAWAFARLLGHNPDFFKFRSVFYFPAMMGRRQIWLPRKDEATQNRLAEYIKKLGYTGSLADFMDVPEQTHIEITIPLSSEQKEALKKLHEEEADPMVRRAKMRTIENGILYRKKIKFISDKEDGMVSDTVFIPNKKNEYILERAFEFPKLFIFAAYTGQVTSIAEMLRREGYTVQTVTGETKNRETIFEEIETMEKGIIVVAAQICEGYRVPSAPCMIFASKSNRLVHYIQGCGRILDGQHLKKNLYIHLITEGNGADFACHHAIQTGEDFMEKLSPL